MGNDCSSLAGDVNACLLSDCALRVEGLASEAASATDTLKITLRPDTTYQGRGVNEALLKIWITRPVVRETDHLVQALLYEVAFYREVVKPLLDSGTCPFFVRMLASSRDCSFDNLLPLYRLAFPPGTPSEKIRRAVDRNLSYMSAVAPGRPAIQDLTNLGVIRRARPSPDRPVALDSEGKVTDDKSDFRFGFLLTETLRGGETLAAYLSTARYADDDEVAVVLLQVAFACQALALSRAAHVDLHLGNILVQRRPHALVAQVEYVDANGTTTSTRVESACHVALRHFERAYAERSGKNAILERLNSRARNMSNELVENRDVLKALGSVLFYHSPLGRDPQNRANIGLSLARKLEKSLAPTRLLRDALKALFETNGHFMTLPSGSPAPSLVFDEFPSTKRILKELMSEMPTARPRVAGAPSVTWRLSESDFDGKTGRLRG